MTILFKEYIPEKKLGERLEQGGPMRNTACQLPTDNLQ